MHSLFAIQLFEKKFEGSI